MTKQEYAKAHGLKIRKATKAENAAATCNAGKNAKFVIETDSGRAFWSGNGTMEDLKRANAAVNSEPYRSSAKANSRKSNAGKTARRK